MNEELTARTHHIYTELGATLTATAIAGAVAYDHEDDRLAEALQDINRTVAAAYEALHAILYPDGYPED